MKSGNDWTRHNALDHVLSISEWNLEQAYVLCKGNLHVDGKIVYLPLYMAMFLEPERLPSRMPYEIDLSGL